MAQLLFGNGDVDGSGHKFRDPQYRQRREHHSASRWTTYAKASEDLQRSVFKRHVSFDNRGGRYGYATPLSRCLRIRPRYDPHLSNVAKQPFNNPTGTSLICAFLEIFMSWVPPKVLQRIFPPMVTGTVILVIGASLVGQSGIPNWGGGSNDCRSRPEAGFFRLCPNIAAPKPKLYFYTHI